MKATLTTILEFLHSDTIDFSSVTGAQIDIVDRLASPNREIHLLHVTEPDPSFVGLEAGPEEVQHQVANELQRAQAELEALADRLRESGHTANILLVPGPTVQTIVEQAEKLDAEVIVMGSHGRGKLFDLVVGSVSAGVIRKSPVPVLVVPAPGQAYAGTPPWRAVEEPYACTWQRVEQSQVVHVSLRGHPRALSSFNEY